MSRIVKNSALAAAAALLAATAPVTAAAQPHGDPPKPAQCAQWARGLAAGGREAIEALGTGWLGGCPDVGPAAFAAALSRAGAESDTAYLSALSLRAGAVTHPAVFAAALRLAGDRSATVEARAAALLALAGQFGSGMDIDRRGGGALLTSALPDAGPCYVGVRTSGPVPPATERLPDDARRRGAVVVDRIRTDATEPALLRNLARCLRPVVGHGVPPQVDVSAVRLTYVCGNWFRLRNPTTEPLTFRYEADRTGERYRINVPAAGERMFATGGPATVKLYYDDRLVHTAAHGGERCVKK